MERSLRTLRGWPLLAGHRGAPGVDLGALGALVTLTGETLLREGLDLLELNPVIAGPDGAVAVDATAWLPAARPSPIHA